MKQGQLETAKASRRPIEEVVTEYEEYLKGKGNTAGHVREAIRCVRAVLGGIGVKCLAEIEVQRVERWLNKVIKSGGSARTRNVYLARIKGLLNWAVDRGLLERNMLGVIRTLREEADRREVSRTLTPEEFESLIDATPSVERQVYYLLSGRCGLRWQEVRRVRWENIDLKRGWLHLEAWATKAGREEELLLAADVVGALRELGVRASGVVFRSSPTLRTFRRDLERAGIPYETERGQADRKSLRKTFGTHLAMAGVDLRVASWLMRHSDVRLTAKVYTDPMLLDMKGAVNRLAHLWAKQRGNKGVTNRGQKAGQGCGRVRKPRGAAG